MYSPVHNSGMSGTNARKPIQVWPGMTNIATMLAMTAIVKVMDNQRWVCRIQVLKQNLL